MRRIAFALAVATCVSGAWAGNEGGGGVIHLYTEASLAELRDTNFAHYLRAQKIIAAADHLCRPTAAEVEHAKFDAKDISCVVSLIRTSNPPKREISFRLDDTRYIALVTLTDDPPKLVAADSRR